MDKLFAHGKKRISDSEISNRDAKKISGELGFSHGGERHEFEESLHGSVTREKIHDKLQEMVAKGKITEKKARSVTNQLGIERKDLRTFEDVSEYRLMHKNEISKDSDKSAVVRQSVYDKNNNSNPEETEDSGVKKPRSIYNILHKN